MSLGNEAFLLCSYLVAASSSSLPMGLGPMVAKAGGFVSGWFSPLFSILFADSAGEGSSPQFITPAAETTTTTSTGGGSGAAAGATAGEMELDGGGFGGFEPSRWVEGALVSTQKVW